MQHCLQMHNMAVPPLAHPKRIPNPQIKKMNIAEPEETKLMWIYWIAVALSAFLGIDTLVPHRSSKPCLLGYNAHCPFAPISTVICWVISAAIYCIGTTT